MPIEATYYHCPSPLLIISDACTCEANLLIAEQAEDAVVELHVSAVVLLHLSQYAHQFRPGLGWMGALALVRRKLVEGTLPGAANPLVLALSHPSNITKSVKQHTRGEEHGST